VAVFLQAALLSTTFQFSKAVFNWRYRSLTVQAIAVFLPGKREDKIIFLPQKLLDA